MKKLIILSILIVLCYSQKEDMENYLKATKNCQVGDEKIKEALKNITLNTTNEFDKLKKIYTYVKDKIKYKVYSGTQLGAIKTLEKKNGNAIDKAHLLVALLRTAKIPARYKEGLVTFKKFTIGHVWVQAYYNKKWYNLDATSRKNKIDKITNWKLNKEIKTTHEIGF